VKPRTWGFLALVIAAFAAGSKAGVEYAKSVYVSKDRKFIKGEVVGEKKE
jgi:hypothetical protein